MIIKEKIYSIKRELKSGEDWDIPFISVEIRSSNPETFVSWCNEMKELEISIVKGELNDEWIEFDVRKENSYVKIVFNGDLAKKISEVLRMLKK